MSTEVDHVVIAARDLEQGRQWCQDVLGVEPVTGGQHALMGTHNLLVHLGGATHRGSYLEIIAVDPQAPPPGRPRWFGLDEPVQGSPRLAQIVVRTEALEAVRLRLLGLGVDPGPVVPLARGDLRWRMLIHAQACMPGALPMLIQWDGRHPAGALPDRSLTLASVAFDGIPEPLSLALGIQGAGGDAQAPAAQHVVIESPRGPVALTRAVG